MQMLHHQNSNFTDVICLRDLAVFSGGYDRLT
jgi:hypothetical protein